MNRERAIAWLRAHRRNLTIWGAVVILLWLFIGGGDGFYVQWRVGRQIGDLRGEIAELREENAALRAQIQRLKTDMAYIERIARERYGMARPGERVYRVLPTTDPNNEKSGNE